jgi:hypothetical protein
MTNEDLLRLTLNGTAENAILAAIYEGPARFDLRSNALISLRQQGVSKLVIAAMLAGDTRQPLTAAAAAPAMPAAPSPTTIEPAHATTPPVGISSAAAVPLAPPSPAAVSTFELAVFRGTRRLLVSKDRIEFVSKDIQGRTLPDSFTATCDDLSERKPGRFDRSLHVQLKAGRRYVFDVNKEVLIALMAALTDACD